MRQSIGQVAVITSDPSLREKVVAAVANVDRTAEYVLERTPVDEVMSAALTDELQRSAARLLILDIETSDASVVRDALDDLARQVPKLVVLVTGEPLSAGSLLEIMRAGAADFLPKPTDVTSLTAALARVGRHLFDGNGPKSVGRVLGVLGPKGGTGVTTVATNLAIELHQITRQRVMLADLNVQLGTASTLLGLRPRYTFAELVKNLHRLDEDLLASYVTEHSSGIAFLPSPLTARELEGVTKPQLSSTVSLLSERYDYVVLDLGNSLSPLARAGLGTCDQVCVVLAPEVPALRNAKRMLPLLGQSVATGRKGLHFVVNRFDPNLDIPLGQMREVIGQDVSLTLPKADRAMSHAANVGRPYVLDGASKYQKAIEKLIAAVLPDLVRGDKSKNTLRLLQRFTRSKRPKPSVATGPGKGVAKTPTEDLTHG